MTKERKKRKLFGVATLNKTSLASTKNLNFTQPGDSLEGLHHLDQLEELPSLNPLEELPPLRPRPDYSPNGPAH